jgi:copper chaperone CopZ
MTRKLTHKAAGVKHHLPHRTRLKMPTEHRDPHTLNKVKESLKKVPGVKDVQVNERTGSVLVEHDERDDMLESVGEALNDVAGELFEAVLEASEIEVPGLSIFAHLIRTNLSKADTDVAVATNNLLDLKMLVPMILLGAGFVKARGTNWWGEVPAWVLFYYAYDSYMKFHGPSVREISATERIETEEGMLTNPKRRVQRRAQHNGELA